MPTNEGERMTGIMPTMPPYRLPGSEILSTINQKDYPFDVDPFQDAEYIRKVDDLKAYIHQAIMKEWPNGLP